MSDIFNKEKRSLIMSKVRSTKNMSTELRLISVFKKYGISGWRRNYKIEGKPDFVFLSKKIAIFADGCFWHGHDCRNLSPSDNKNYWSAKVLKNRNRDSYITERLEQKGWLVLRLWECELKNKNREHLLLKLSPLITKPIH